MHIVEVGALVVAACFATVVILRVDPAWTLSGALVATVFSGHWDRLGHVPLDRILLAAGAAVLLLKIGPARDRPAIRLGWVHVLLAAVVIYASVSALWTGTLHTHDSRFDIIDRLGAVPFAVFAISPVAFYDRRRRGILLGALVVLGFYLGLTAVLEGTKIKGLVWPRYILDDAYGIHSDRARGPFVEAVPMGLALIACGTAAVMALTTWRDRFARLVARATVLLCLAGVSLTYTRSVWIAAGMGLVVVLAAYADLWRWLLPTVGSVVVGFAIAIAVIPGFGSKLSHRYHESSPIWVRRHTEGAALRMIAARPITGFGENTFQAKSQAYFRDIPEIKLTGFHEQVHNAVLGRAVELGLPGAALWLLAILCAFVLAAFRRVRGELVRWQRGYVVVLVSATVTAMLTPFGWSFPEILIAMWAGLLLTREPLR
jgi:putative inorganic carbon (HCO3(-)) transporter